MIRELLLLSLGLAVLAQWEMVPVYPEKRTTSGHYCGEALTSTLNFICDGFFNSPFTVKKSYDYRFYPDYASNELAEGEKTSIMFPFSTRSKAHSILEYRRLRRGVHDECCKKSCSLSELQSYCGRSTKKN